MKNLLIYLLYFIPLSTAYSQKNDNIWLLGFPPNKPEKFFGGSNLDFNNGEPTITYFNIPGHLGGSTAISDSVGVLQFYSNGCYIYNSNHEIMDNGDTLNPGTVFNNHCSEEYPVWQGLIALPKPGISYHYTLFHLYLSSDLINTELLYSEIDMSLNQGKGRVISKNKLIYRDTFCNNLTAVKHANGRDWWIVSPRNSYNQKNHSNEYFIFLLDPNGISGPFIQSIGPVWESTNWGGQATFSPDGSRYARINPFSGLYLYDFDRCSGSFSSPLHFNFPNDTFIVSTGVSFSPSSRFLYALTTSKIYQYDVQNADIEATKTIVAEYDGFIDDNLPTYFFQAEIAPNGKIYATAPNSVKFLHCIEQPDLKGVACNVRQHSLALKSYAGWEIPNFPHFRLGSLQGSTCDTLTKTINAQDDSTKIIHFNCYPNPVNEVLNISFSKSTSQIIRIDIFDLFGHKVLSKDILQGNNLFKINVSNIQSGIYLLKLSDKIEVIGIMKVIIE